MNDPHQTYVQNEGLATAVFGDESVILNTERGLYFGTNELGTQIFALLETPRTHDDLVAKLAEEYEVDIDRLRADVSTFLDQLETNGLIRAVPSHETQS